MELRQLEYFAEVCRVRNFTKASENLHVAQPAVTKSIQRLEEELGTQLIDRTVKPLRLTERGERFYRRVEDILRRLEDAVAEAAEQVNSHRPLSVCVSPMSGILVDEMLREDDVVDQGFFYNIVTRSSIETLDRLMRRELDLGIVMEVDIPPELEFIPLEEQQALCLMPPDDPLTELEVLTFADLRDARFSGRYGRRKDRALQVGQPEVPGSRLYGELLFQQAELSSGYADRNGADPAGLRHQLHAGACGQTDAGGGVQACVPAAAFSAGDRLSKGPNLPGAAPEDGGVYTK